MKEKKMKIKELINYGVNLLQQNKIEEPILKSRLLLSYVLNHDKVYLTINENEEVSRQEETKYKELLNEIINGKPLQYITNNQEFMGLQFYVDEHVLIPQPDTEILVEEVINEIKNGTKILDLCTGSGAIAVSIAKKIEKEIKNNKIEVYASDISEQALRIAKKNAKINEVTVKFIRSDMFKEISEKFDIIISNPPYIETDVIKSLSQEVKAEPNLALDGGKDGLNFYRIIADNAYLFLNQNGKIFLEIGYNQRQAVTAIFEDKKMYDNIICLKDLAGNDRVLSMIVNGDGSH